MPLHLIIDGYNLIRQSARWSAIERRDLQSGREALVDAVAAYRRLKRHPVTVVFDAAEAPCFLERRDRWKGIEIRFSPCGGSADDVIRRIAARQREGALVVTSDREVAAAAAGCGAAVISSSEFEQRLEMALAMGQEAADDEDQGWIPTTRKKGPRKRLPKGKRRQKSRLDKL